MNETIDSSEICDFNSVYTLNQKKSKILPWSIPRVTRVVLNNIFIEAILQ